MMAKALKAFIINMVIGFFTSWVEDFLIFAGLVLLIVNTYLISVIQTNILVGNYLLSAVLIFVGVILAKR